MQEAAPVTTSILSDKKRLKLYTEILARARTFETPLKNIDFQKLISVSFSKCVLYFLLLFALKEEFSSKCD